jgi:hypothetical protein
MFAAEQPEAGSGRANVGRESSLVPTPGKKYKYLIRLGIFSGSPGEALPSPPPTARNMS